MVVLIFVNGDGGNRTNLNAARMSAAGDGLTEPNLD